MASVIKLSDNSTVLDNVISTTYKECLNSGVDLRPGCVGSMMLEVEVFNTQANAVQAGDKLYYYQLDTAGNETLVGVFYAEPKISTKNSYRFTAYDIAQKLNADFSEWLRGNQSLFPMTVKTLVQYACTVAGVTLGSTSWTTSGQSVQAFYADGLTCRDIVSYAAEIAGRYAHVHEDEILYFHWYSDTTNKRIYPESGTSGSETRYAYKQDGLQYANYTVPAIDGVAVHPSGEDDVAYIYPTTPSGDNLLHIKNNLLLTGANASFYNLVAQTVYTQMTAAAVGTNGAYVPMTAQLFPRENPYEAGEAVDVTDSQGVSFRSIIMSRTITDAAVTLESTGNETQGEGGNTQKAITQLASDVVRINKLKVDWAEIDTAIINYLTANNVTAQNLTIVDENNNVLATFDSNGITLGQTGDTHAELDYNSFELLDKDGNTYVNLGDLRDSTGYAEVEWSQYFGVSLNPSFSVPYNIHSISSIISSILGTLTGYTFSGNTITLQSATQKMGILTVTFTTDDPIYHYDLGKRENGSYVGAYSLVCGENNAATGDKASVLSGEGNKARSNCGVVFGKYNTADSNKAEIVGNGDDDNNRSNARTLDWNGNEVLAGTLTQKGNIKMLYEAGDTVSFDGNTRAQFAGGFRGTNALLFTIPLCKPIASGVSASISGYVTIYSNGSYRNLNLTDAGVTTTCFVCASGVTVRVVWSTVPSYFSTQTWCGVQDGGLTITFS